MILALTSKYKPLSLLTLALKHGNKKAVKSPLGEKRVQYLETKCWLPVWESLRGELGPSLCSS